MGACEDSGSKSQILNLTSFSIVHVGEVVSFFTQDEAIWNKGKERLLDVLLHFGNIFLRDAWSGDSHLPALDSHVSELAGTVDIEFADVNLLC